MHELDRRTFVAGVGATIGGLLTSTQDHAVLRDAARTGSGRTGGGPNVVILICDDIGFGDLGCYGSALNTPNLNRLASKGVRFTRYDSPHPLCSAARAALLTGRYATRTGAKQVYFPESVDGLSLDEVTLADVLHQKQYKSMCIGKWHLGSKPEYLPTNRGFDSYFGVPYSVDMRPLPMIRDQAVLEQDTDRALLTPRYTEEAIKLIDSSHNGPFFLYLAYSYPHIPINASPRFRGRSKKGIYGDAVEEIDWSVGEVLASLERNHIDENTLLIFTGDHGPWYQGSTAQLRGRKGTTYEGGYRVPFLARWKGVIPPGRVESAWASHLDIVPTIASICDAKIPSKPLDGVNIVDLLTDRQNAVEKSAMLYFSALHRDDLDLQCIRRGNWKLRISQYSRSTLVLADAPGENLLLSQPELYNLGTDPGENYDVAQDYPEIVSQLQREIDVAIQTFPQSVIQAHRELKTRLASPTTPQDSQARPASYVCALDHYD